MDVSIILVNYNTCEVTKNCIDSIFEKTNNINFEVILVDNNSQDESQSIFSTDKRIKYIYLNSNIGFGKANNIGLRHAKGKYLFLLNSDTLLISNAVKEFFDFMESTTDKIACVGTILKDSNNNYSTSYNSFPTFITGLEWFTLLGPYLNKLGIVKNHTKKILNTIQEVDFVSGADIFMNKNVADKYGLFDADFFMYFEETEMQYRYNKLGFKNLIFPIPQIIHLEEYSTNRSCSNNYLKKRSLLLNSYFIYLKKTKGTFIYYIFRLIFGLISPLLLISSRYSYKDKINFILKAYK